MAPALILPVFLLLLPLACCLSQFGQPPPRKIGDPAIPFTIGQTYNIVWETTATSYALLFHEDQGPDSTFYNLSQLLQSQSQVTSPFPFLVGSNLNLGAYYFSLATIGDGDVTFLESDNVLVVDNTASPAQLSSAGVSVAFVTISNTESDTVAASTNTPSQTSGTEIATITTQSTVTASSLETTSTYSPTSFITTSATANPAAGTNTLAVGLGVGLGVPLALAILTAIYFLFRHQRVARRLAEKGGAGNGVGTTVKHGAETDMER